MRAVVENIEDRAAFKDEWRRIFSKSDALFFLSPPWVETLMETAAHSAAFKYIRIFDDLRGVYGAAIVGAQAGSMNRGAPARINESGDDELDRVYLEYNDILLANGAADEARIEAINALIEAMPKTNEFVFRNARPALASAVKAAGAGAGLTARPLLRQPTYYIDLSSEIMNGYSSSLRYKIRRARRCYEERGDLRLEIPQGEAERDVAWTELMRLHARTWSGRGKKGVFGSPQFLAFHRRLIERRPSCTDLLRILAGDQTIGVLYNFVDRERAYNYQSGFFYEANNQLAPGFVAHTLAAEYYRARGLKTYDLMGGDADYKRRLGEEGETLETIVLERTGIRSGIRTGLRNFLTSARRVRNEGMRRT
ncbi:MAG: GNAT family N-acetyltransferase [Parvularculaceae bacterium]|nr:GNAT family N-acetyltransferase [Parvularculaceae bacterium]